MQQKIEITDFHQALKSKAIHYNTHLVIDLDNTIETAILGDAWFESVIASCKQRGMALETALPALKTIYDATQGLVQTSPTEPNIALLIKTFQDIGLPVIGLTARSFKIRNQTLRQLADIGIDFSRNSIVWDDNLSRKSGIIFCNGGDKGDRLSEFYASIQVTPQSVVMFDDKEKHLNSVMRALDPEKTVFIGFRYGHLDQAVLEFNMADARKQLAELWDRFPEDIQHNILLLNLLTEDALTPTKSIDYAEAFFPPDSPSSLSALSIFSPPKAPLSTPHTPQLPSGWQEVERSSYP